jgi:Fe-S-cluster-containing hydrogenase component 2
MTVSAKQQPNADSNDGCWTCPGDCQEACFNDAIVSISGRSVQIETENCAGCGACIAACDLGRIRLAQGVAQIVSI